ncbi:MAG: hypothetical protein ACLT8E_04185 [Akkermansia sp.]
MLKQIWRWVSLFPLLHPVWFNLLLLVLAWSLVGVAYQSNDDLVIASVLDGWGDPSYADAHVIFVNPLLTGRRESGSRSGRPVRLACVSGACHVVQRSGHFHDADGACPQGAQI